MFLDSTHLTAELMEHGSSTPGRSTSDGVRHLLCQGDCLVAAHPCLLRIPQTPQHPSGTAETIHPRVRPGQREPEHRGVVLSGMVMHYTLCIVCMRGGDCSHAKQGH